jgi:hypothetical protein
VAGFRFLMFTKAHFQQLSYLARVAILERAKAGAHFGKGIAKGANLGR